MYNTKDLQSQSPLNRLPNFIMSTCTTRCFGITKLLHQTTKVHPPIHVRPTCQHGGTRILWKSKERQSKCTMCNNIQSAAMCDNLPNILIVDCPCCGNEVVAERPDPECA